VFIFVKPHRAGDGYAIYALKTKNNAPPATANGASVASNNPVFKWVMSTTGAGVHAFEFSPCGRFIAIAMQVSALHDCHQNFHRTPYAHAVPSPRGEAFVDLSTKTTLQAPPKLKCMKR